MVFPTDGNRDSSAIAAANVPPMQYGLRSIFVVTTIAAVLVAGATSDGFNGFLVALAFLIAGVSIWAIWKKQQIFFGFLGSLAALLILLLLPVYEGRGPSNRASCMNNMKQVGLSLLNYEEHFHHLPPAYIADQAGRRMHSWRTLILPEIEEGTLYNSLRLDEPWDSPNNRKLSQTELLCFRCPENKSLGPYDTSYVAIIGSGTAWSVQGGAKLSDFKDGPSNTILLVEMQNSGIKWSEPRDLDLDHLPPGITKQNLLQSLSNHSVGFNAVFADAHVEFLPETIPWADFEAMLTIAGGEKVDRSNW